MVFKKSGGFERRLRPGRVNINVACMPLFLSGLNLKSQDKRNTKTKKERRKKLSKESYPFICGATQDNLGSLSPLVGLNVWARMNVYL